jgi:hypothetical protein
MAAGFVGIVLLLAGAAKLSWDSAPGASGRGSLAAAFRFRLLPPVELVTGALLVAGFWWAGIPAALLLIGFTVFLAIRVARHSTEPCKCFGEAAVRPVGRLTLARNLVLLAAAVVVAGRWDLGGWLARVVGVGLGVALVATERGIGHPPATTVLHRAHDS